MISPDLKCVAMLPCEIGNSILLVDNFENRSVFGEVTEKSNVSFFDPQCSRKILDNTYKCHVGGGVRGDWQFGG